MNTWEEQTLNPAAPVAIAPAAPAVNTSITEASDETEVDRIKAEADKIKETIRLKTLQGEFCQLNQIANKAEELNQRERVLKQREANSQQLQEDNMNLTTEIKKWEVKETEIKQREAKLQEASIALESSFEIMKKEQDALSKDLQGKMSELEYALRFLALWAVEQDIASEFNAFLNSSPRKQFDVLSQAFNNLKERGEL